MTFVTKNIFQKISTLTHRTIFLNTDFHKIYTLLFELISNYYKIYNQNPYIINLTKLLKHFKITSNHMLLFAIGI